MSSQTLEDMISTLLAEEKRATVGDSQPKIALYLKKRMGRRMASKSEIECNPMEK